MTAQKKIIIIAGPNGAGKTTFAREFLPHEASCPVFVNADVIAASLSPNNPELAAIRAGRIMLQELAQRTERMESFAFETTLAGRAYVRLIREWRQKNYRVKLVFLRLLTPEAAIARVAERVAQGGHNIPDDVVRRRFFAGLDNFDNIYSHEVDVWERYDSSGDRWILVDKGHNS